MAAVSQKKSQCGLGSTVFVLEFSTCKTDRRPLLIMKIEAMQSMSELAAGGISDKTVFTHLKQIGKIKEIERWVPHELSESNAR